MGDKPVPGHRSPGMHRRTRDKEQIIIGGLITPAALAVNLACALVAAYAQNLGIFAVGWAGACSATYALAVYWERMPMGYRSLAMQLRWELANNDYRPGQKLPAIVEIAAKYKTTNTTAMRAMRVLAGEGLVDIIQGRGTYLVGADRMNVPDWCAPKEKVQWHLLDLAGSAQPGDLMPSARALSIAYNTDYESIHQIQQDLVKDGIIRPTTYGEYTKA